MADDEPLITGGGQLSPRVLNVLRESFLRAAREGGQSLANAARGTAVGMEESGRALASPFINMVFGPSSAGASLQRGLVGDIPTVEQQIPWAGQTALATMGMSTPFSLSGAVGAGGGRLTQKEIARAVNRAASRSAGLGPGAPAGPVAGRPAYITPEGFAIKGTPFSKRSREVLDELAQMPKETGPMDLATAAQIPNVEQKALERYVPGRGVSDRLARALENQDVIAGVKESIEEGKRMGAHRWYHTEPVRQAFAKAYEGSNSDPGGAKAFKQFMDLVAATSPRSDVPTNIRNASYYHHLASQGLPIPEKLPYPYGHVAQVQHMERAKSLGAAAIERPGESGWDIFANPKPASFSENLQGNLEPVTADTHAFRNIGMRTGDPEFLETSLRGVLKGEIDPEKQTLINKYGELHTDKKGQTIVTFRPQQLHKEGKLTMEEAQKIPMFWASQPRENEYAAVEEFYRRLAKEHGLAPADAQAAAWAGGGKLTGLGSPPTMTFPELLNQRVEYTARMRNEDPQETLLKMIRGQTPLLGLAGAGATVPGILGNVGQDQY